MYYLEIISLKTIQLLFTILLFFVSVPSVDAASPQPLLLFYSGNIRSETEACG